MEARGDVIRLPIYRKKILRVVITLTILLLSCITLCLFLGTARVSPAKLVYDLFQEGGLSKTSIQIVFSLRLPRLLLAATVGYALSLGGVVFQAVLRNPLADPFILGVSSGAGLGAVVAILLGLGFHWGVPLLAFLGSMLSIVIVMVIGRKDIGVESSTILLSGVIVNAFFTAFIMFFITTSTDSRLHTMLFWLYGDLSQAKYWPLWLIWPVLISCSLIVYGFSRHLNIITVGEEMAAQLGMNVEKVVWINVIAVSLVMGVVVSFSGIIGFVGLLVPHLMRMLLGSDHRILIPASALGGGCLMVLADTTARTIISPNELPVGVLTAFLGAPFFIYLLKTKGTRWPRS